MASGPSLTAEDVERVHAWRQADDSRRVVVTNTTFRAAPWADVLAAMDLKWWRVHHAEVSGTFKGKSYTTATLPINQRVATKVRGVYDYRNSGAFAVSLSDHFGAAMVVLLGFDCRHDPAGLTHWHGSHPSGLGDAASVKRWPAKFAELARGVRARVVNCSRVTALECFERGDLADVLRS